ncbi:MAG: prepilin-type N-terminal cleavage/methylation domain-containing protein [Thermoguttaceae bacterium]|nr:prepilin-type N-terminal cleavage/methylation domain-containing protein [Thermoguttaceae bacterium]
MRTRSKEKGLTLIELLVVGTIILILAVIALPLVKPMIDSQQTRSASQVVSTYLNRAKNRARLTGRPCGVRFEVFPGTEEWGGASLVMRQVEVPPVYTGFMGTEMGSVFPADHTGPFRFVCDDPYLQRTLRPGNRVQVGGSGPYYTVKEVLPGYFTLEEPVTTPTTERGGKFRVQLAPRPTMTPPVALPQGTVVDLKYSGCGGDWWDFWYDDTATPQILNRARDVTVMFSPSGEISLPSESAGLYPAGPLFLLIGRWDQIPAVRDSGEEGSWPNWADGRNYWVVVQPQSGLVTTAEVNPVPLPDGASDVNGIDSIFMGQSREFATQIKRNIGGY